jgi:hypothetical protein
LREVVGRAVQLAGVSVDHVGYEVLPVRVVRRVEPEEDQWEQGGDQ